MLPMVALRTQLGTLLAADATTLAPASNPNKIALISAPFTPNENLTVSGLTLATFTGSTPIAGVAGAQAVAQDPSTGQQIITLKDPAGGYRWVTTNTVNLPQTIYGWCLLDTTLAILLGVQAFGVPIALTAAGQQIDLGPAAIRFVLQPMS